MGNLYAGASALGVDEVERERSYKVATKVKIPETQTPSCFKSEERHRSILA